MPIKYIEVECTHFYIASNSASKVEEKGFVLSLDEIACIRRYEYIARLDNKETALMWRIHLKCWNDNHTILVSKECGDEIIKTLYTNGELLKIEEKGNK